ncbi:hypothetical protein ACLPHM_00885 [Paenalcaligenes sp. Me131]|uniref:hypothetical protein n=1 Tax=Paenalcaligenes sp. Me131 TaxID=3392636 RepID=UPI003D2D490E
MRRSMCGVAVVVMGVLLTGCTLTVSKHETAPPVELGAFHTSYSKQDIFVPLPWVVGNAQRPTDSQHRK